MIEKIGAAGALIVAVWALGVGIDRAGGGRIVRSGEREGVLTPETPIDLDAVVAARTVKHTALISLSVPKVTAIDPGSVQIETPGYTVDDVRTTPILEFRREANPKPRSLLVLLDNSRSMAESGAGLPPSDPTYRRLDACQLLLDALPNTDQVSLACFPCRKSVDDQSRRSHRDIPYELLAPASTPTVAAQSLDKLRDEENGSTPLYRAVVAASQTLEASPPGRRRILVLLTDGRNMDLEQGGSLAQAADAIRRAGVEMYAVGLGAGADNETLRGMTPHVLRVDDATTLDRTFRQIVQQMSREVVEVDLDLVVGRTGSTIPPGRKIDITFRSNGRLYRTKGVTK